MPCVAHRTSISMGKTHVCLQIWRGLLRIYTEAEFTRKNPGFVKMKTNEYPQVE